MSENNRLLIIGAGFSKLAGLPLGNELFNLVRNYAKKIHGNDNILEAEIEDYKRYNKDSFRKEIDDNNISLEELLSFMDIEHVLRLRGKDTWSNDGNEAQEMIKRLIAKIIHNNTPNFERLPKEYLEFAKNLRTCDIIITFNYDTIIEDILDNIGLPYRLFQHRFKTVNGDTGFIDDEKKEITVLKLHGSIDWFDKTEYIELKESTSQKLKKEYNPVDPIFNSKEDWGIEPILSGPRLPIDSMKNIYRIRKLNKYYSYEYPPATPYIISPSYCKYVYTQRLKDLWDGILFGGSLNFGLAIIGFSLTNHDEYIHRIIYTISKNYQNNYWGEDLYGFKKTKLKLIDFRATEDDINNLKKRYCFLDEKKTLYHLKGFNSEAIEIIFNNE